MSDETADEITADELHKTLTGVAGSVREAVDQLNQVLRLVNTTHGRALNIESPLPIRSKPTTTGLNPMIEERLDMAIMTELDPAKKQLLIAVRDECVAMTTRVKRAEIDYDRYQAMSWTISPVRMGG